MEKWEFSGIRGRLGKTQTQMAQLLGSSLGAIQSFEQGLRKVPVHVERQALFLLATMRSHQSKIRPCWAIKKCSLMARRNCPAWEFQIGHLCWFINGTICNGEVQESWQEKMKMCRQCEVFLSMLPNLKK
jgi:DNA-binding XRE family transcriptional regulator